MLAYQNPNMVISDYWIHTIGSLISIEIYREYSESWTFIFIIDFNSGMFFFSIFVGIILVVKKIWISKDLELESERLLNVKHSRWVLLLWIECNGLLATPCNPGKPVRVNHFFEDLYGFVSISIGIGFVIVNTVVYSQVQPGQQGQWYSKPTCLRDPR